MTGLFWKTPKCSRSFRLTSSPILRSSASDMLIASNLSLASLALLAESRILPNCACAGTAADRLAATNNARRDVRPMLSVPRAYQWRWHDHFVNRYGPGFPFDHHVPQRARVVVAFEPAAALWLMIIRVLYSLFSDSSREPRFTLSPMTV